MLLTDLWTISISLKTILCETGIQCSSFEFKVNFSKKKSYYDDVLAENIYGWSCVYER